MAMLVAETPELETMTAHQLMLFAIFGILIVGAIFVLLVLVRIWGARTQSRKQATAGLDLDRLKSQLDAGHLSPEEYAAVRRHLVGTTTAPGGPRSARLAAPDKAEGAPANPTAAGGEEPSPDPEAEGPGKSIELPEGETPDPGKEPPDG